jgi:hypothetical protein
MSQTHDVISAFLDGEPFDPTALGQALADPAGRALLMDFVALGQLVRDVPPTAAVVGRPRLKRAMVAAAAAAALLLASLGGYAWGERRGAAAAEAPPVPTRVVQVTTGWQ